MIGLIATYDLLVRVGERSGEIGLLSWTTCGAWYFEDSCSKGCRGGEAGVSVLSGLRGRRNRNQYTKPKTSMPPKKPPTVPPAMAPTFAESLLSSFGFAVDELITTDPASFVVVVIERLSEGSWVVPSTSTNVDTVKSGYSSPLYVKSTLDTLVAGVAAHL